MNQEDDCLNDDRQPFPNSMPKAITLTDHSYSLEIDMLTGWVPKIESCKLLALNFANQVNDEIIAKAITDNKLIYLGFRPQDTGQLHKQYSNSATYSYKQSKTLIRKPQIPFMGMNPSIDNPIQFNSIFESGNLDVVIRKTHYEYDLFMRVDSNTKGHTSWYNFEVKGLKKGETIQLNICNMAKSRSLYERGMRPYIWRSSKQEWVQGGENVQYTSKAQLIKIYNCLSFTITGESDNDLIKIAYCVPYTYSQMLDWCQKMIQKCNFVEKTTFCESVSGVNLPLLTFSDGLVINKKCLILQARIHPGESNGSWMMQGLLEYMASPKAKSLLSKYCVSNIRCIVKIVPMMNPDGVILGNYRTGVAGRDLNRRFKLTDKTLFPSVFAMKQLVKEQYSIFGENLIGFIDLHGHSVKKNVFLYGPEFTLWNYNYYKCRLLAKLLSQKTEMFRFYSSIFRISQQKRSTARGVFAELYDLVNCFTIEASNGSYYNSTQTHNFTTQNWIQMGHFIGESLNELVEMQMEMDFIYGMKGEELKRANRQIKNNIINKRRSLTGNQEDQCFLQFQNTKFAKLFEEIKLDADKMNQSYSEGGSDSESSDDDYSETQLDDIKEQIQDIAMKPKTKPSVSILQPAIRSKIQDTKFSPRGQKQQPSQQSILLSMQQSEKRLNIPRSAQNSVLKKSSIIKPNRITNYVSAQQSATIEYKEDQVPNYPLQQLLHQTMTRPSTAKFEEVDDENFFPIQGFTSSHYNVFKRHTRLRSNLTVNKKVKEKKPQPQPTPPLLQQMGINLKAKVSTQTNFEQLGIKIKPKHFLAPKKQEEPSLNDFSKSQNMIVDMQSSTRPPKPNIPPSFYSVKRHMMLRLKN